MPMWCPPTPPQQDGDIYMDQTMSFLYDTGVMAENQLPPVYVKKEVKRTRVEAGLADPRRGAIKIRKEECTYPPRSLFERRSPTLVKIRRGDVRIHKFRGAMVKSTVPVAGIKYPSVKPSIDPPCLHNWTIHEENALLKVVQTYQGSALNLMIRQAGHTLNWDFVADYVNTVSIAYRSPKQCRNRYETVLVAREEGKQVIDTSPRKKKNQKGQNMYKFPIPNKSSRPMCTSQLYLQDNNSSFSQLLSQRHDTLMNIVATKKTTVTKAVVSNPLLKNPKHAMILSEAGIDIDHPVLPVEVAARRAERTAREKKMTPEMAQKLQMLRAAQNANAAVAASSSSASASTASPVHSASSSPQITVVQSSAPAIVSTTVTVTPNTPPTTLRAQRIVASPMQNPTVVSVSGITPAQLQNVTQRLIVSGTTGQAKATVVSPAGTVSTKSISPAQLQLIRQASIKQHLRLQSGSLAQGVKTTTVTIPGQPSVQVQFTQAQQKTQYLKPATVTVAGKQGLMPRALTDSEMAHFLKRQQMVQKLGTGQHATTIQSPQVIQAIQAGPSGTQVATLVKAVSSAGVTQTVIGTPVKALPQGLKTPQQQLRTLQIHHHQQHMLAQKKLANSKIAGIAQVAGKSGVATQLIVGPKPLSTAMTVQQLHQAMRGPMNQGPVLLAKGPPPRVIPLNGQGTKPTIQVRKYKQLVVQATTQGGITTTIRPQTSSALSGALAGIKMQGSAQNQQAILTHVSAALQGQHVRQNSPVRIQTASGTPLVAVTVQSGSPNVQPGLSPQNADKGVDHEQNNDEYWSYT